MSLNVPVLLFLYLAVARPASHLMIGANIFGEQFFMGIGTVGSIVFMMQQICPGPFKTAHYGIATGIMGAGMIIPGTFCGWISDHIGYTWFFVYALIAAIPSFFVALKVPFREIPKQYQDKPA